MAQFRDGAIALTATGIPRPRKSVPACEIPRNKGRAPGLKEACFSDPRGAVLSFDERELRDADRRIARASEIVAKQRLRIAALEARGRDTRKEQGLLTSLENTLEAFREHRRLLAKLRLDGRLSY